MTRLAVDSVYSSGKMAVLLGLGFAAGLPYLLTGRTMKVWARREDVDLATIGLFSLVWLPYAYKFLWAPVLDRFSPPFLGRRRGWLVVIQILLIMAIAGMAFTGPGASATDSLRVFALMAVVVAFLSATQDIVADAYRTDVLLPSELGAGASIYTSGYRLAMLAAGAGAVFLADSVSWTTVYLLEAAMLAVGIVAALMAPEPTASFHSPRTFREAVLEPFSEFLRRNGSRAAVVLVFIFAFKLPDYMAGAMTDALLVDLGFSNRAISLWSLGVGTAVTIPGALLGGPIVVVLGIKRSLVVFGLAQALSNGGYLLLAKAGEPNLALMILVVGIEYFCMGLVAAGFIAFMMSQCNQRYSATQYALLSSLMGLASSLGGAPAGVLVKRLDYDWFFVLTILIAIPGMALLPWLPKRSDIPEQHTEIG